MRRSVVTASEYVEGPGGSTLFGLVEWMEIESEHRQDLGMLVAPRATDRSQEIHHALVESKVDFEVSDEAFRIFGYRRSSKQKT